jgi:succinoglycan biosynthesis transport protein ExoP
VTLKAFFEVVRKRWLWVAVPALMGLCAMAFSSFTTPKTYSATAGVFFSLEFGNSASDLAQGSSFTQNQVASYALLARTPAVLQPVIDEQQLGLTARALAGRVSASVVPDTVVVEVHVSGTDPELAASIANGVAEQLGVTVEQLAPVNDAGEATVRGTAVDPADVPQAPVSPRTRLNLVVGLLGGLLLGLGAALVRDVTDTRVRSAEDLASVTPLPLLAALDTRPTEGGRRDLVVTSGPRTSRAEAFRTLRTSVQFLRRPGSSLSLLVTSARPAEGKSTVAANLALVLAEGGTRVALVDADLRRPSVADTFDLEGAAGLTSVLIGQVELGDVLQDWGSSGLHVLTSGPLPPNPSELLASPAMAAVLAQLEATHDVVLIDAPPLLPVTDAAVLSQVVSGTLVVVKAGATRRAVLREALTVLERVEARVVGVVLSHVRRGGQDVYGYEVAADVPAGGQLGAAVVASGGADPRPPAQAPGAVADLPADRADEPEGGGRDAVPGGAGSEPEVPSSRVPS